MSNNTEKTQKHNIDYDYSSTIKAINKKHLVAKDLHTEIQNKNLSLEEEAKHIKKVFLLQDNVNRNLVEIRTKNWVNFGKMLIEHCERVTKAGYGWDLWVAEHFPFICDRRIEQSMKLAAIGDKLKPLYNLGIDRLYDLFNKLIAYREDPEFLKICKQFHFIELSKKTSKEEKAENCKNADKVREYYKFKRNIKPGNKYSTTLLCAIIESGGTFTKQDYALLNNSTTSEDDRNNFLTKMLINGISPTNHKQSKHQKESINVTLSKIIQTTDTYISNSIYPVHMDKMMVEKAIQNLGIIRQHF